MTGQAKPGVAVSIHVERSLDGIRYLASNHADLISLDFVMSAYRDKTGGVYWATPMDAEMTRLMVQNSCIMGLYRVLSDDGATVAEATTTQPDQQQQLEQVGMARFITDHVTHAYLTDVYVAPHMRRRGLGTWLVECCDGFVGAMPSLPKFMLATSNPRRNAQFYQQMLGLTVREQDPDRHLIMVRSGPGGKARYSTLESSGKEEESRHNDGQA
jgi:GNAT superfamily N-acetyltransferase